jgi:hypothetical protein
MAFMTHPDLPKADPAITTEDAFREVWEKKGWRLVQSETTPAPTARTRPTPEA